MFFTLFGRFFGKTLQKMPKIDQNSAKTLQKPAMILCLLGRWTDFLDWFPTGSQLVPDWFPTGSRLVPDWFPTGSRLVPDWFPTGSRLVPDWFPTGSRLVPDWFPDWFPTGSRWFGGGFWGGWGGGLGVLRKFLVIFGDLERWGKIFGDLEGLERFGGFWRVEWFLVIFTAIWRLWWALGWFFISRKVEMPCHVGKAHSKPCQTRQRALTRCLSCVRPWACV